MKQNVVLNNLTWVLYIYGLGEWTFSTKEAADNKIKHLRLKEKQYSLYTKVANPYLTAQYFLTT